MILTQEEAGAKEAGANEAGDWAAQAEARVLSAALALIPAGGWTWTTVFAAAKAEGLSAGEAELLLPEGPRDLAALFSRACDRAALQSLAEHDPATLKIRERIRLGVTARTAAIMQHPAAARRWTGFLALPPHALLGGRLVWESADVLWRWAGDASTDENHYSKRAILAGLLTRVLLRWLSDGEEAAQRRLDQGIEHVMAFERFKARLKLPLLPRVA
jgi:ubiquinone biosynthesis protein COQ9